MDFITIAKQRMSVRDYKETKVEPEKLEQILEAAHVAPTAANLQPIRLIAVQSEEGLAKIGKAASIYDVLRQEFDLPANLEPVNILVVGYSDEGTGDPNRFNKQRIPMSQLVSYETL